MDRYMRKLFLLMMILNTAFGQKMIFYHIPKTGGSSITNLLDRQFRSELICGDDFYYQIELKKDAELTNYDFFRGHFFYSTKLKDINAFRCVFLREPVSRILSEQRFYLKHYTYPGGLYDLSKEHANQYGDPIKVISNNQVMWLSAYHRDDPKISIEKHFESAKETLAKSMDYVGIFEDLENSIYGLFNILGFDLPSEIPHLQTVDTSYHLTNEQVAEIRQRNYYDILLYDYAKELYLTKFKKFSKN